MDWIVLILGVPLIAAPIVLLLGFSGCAQIAGLDDSAPSDATPPAPTLLTAQAVGTTGVRLTWTPDGSATFFVERALMSGVFSTISLGPSGTTGLSGFTVIDTANTGLTEGTSFRYQLRRSRGASARSAPSAVRRVTTQPNAPDSLQTLTAVPGKVRLQWLNRTAASPIEFEIERQTPPATGTFKVVGTVSNVSEFEETDAAQLELKAGSTHRYRITAVIPSGFANNTASRVKSDPSDEHAVSIA
jgi:hypothetical protein